MSAKQCQLARYHRPFELRLRFLFLWPFGQEPLWCFRTLSPPRRYFAAQSNSAGEIVALHVNKTTMEIFNRILSIAVQGGASDVHIKIGTPVIFRINRQLLSIEAPTPTEEWMNNVVEKIVPKHALKRLEIDREVDYSYLAPGLGRFRTNVFQQRGQWCLAMRYVKTNIPSFAELGLLLVLKKIAESPPGLILV